MSTAGEQNDLPIWKPPLRYPFQLHVNDCVRIDGQFGRVIRVTEAAAVVLVNRPHRKFTTRFDRPVEFRQSPAIIRIAANSEIEVLNRPARKRKKRRQQERRKGNGTA